jgi:hypothetical protein
VTWSAVIARASDHFDSGDFLSDLVGRRPASPGAHRWIMSIIAVSTIAAMVAMTVTRIE